ncbi:hypothetical protein DSTSK_12270 [Desulforhabdus sp. TSK]|nr:hypothetical protein DSTSK_12270 [Desulforhabdus sp. TSK]
MCGPLKIFFLFLLTFLIPGGVSAGDAPSTRGADTPSAQAQALQDGPVIEIAEPTHDFGEAMEDAEISHDFIVKNTGKAVLQIEKVNPG